MPNGEMKKAAQQPAQSAYQLGGNTPMQGGVWAAPRRDEYANSIAIERREFDAVLRFYRRGEDYSDLVREITVPLGALEGLT